MQSSQGYLTPNDSVSPLRPILSVVGTCSYNFEKFFVPLLKQYATNEYKVNDTFSFYKEIVSQGPQLFMASFDIQSLFTNIPLD